MYVFIDRFRFISCINNCKYKHTYVYKNVCVCTCVHICFLTHVFIENMLIMSSGETWQFLTT